MSASIPQPFPSGLRGEAMILLTNRELESLDDSGRFIIRQTLAAFYAAGFQDGRHDEKDAQTINREMQPALAPAVPDETRN